MRKNQRLNQVNDPWYIPAVMNGKPDFGAPRYMTEHLELRKGRRRLFVPFKDNNAGKELCAASISRWICTTIVDSHASLQNNSKSISGKVKVHEVHAVATSLPLFNKVDLQAVMSFYLRDLCPQADSIWKTGPVIAAGEIIEIFS